MKAHIAPPAGSILADVEYYITLLRLRGFNSRDRLLRKLMEEAGEYAEAMEYNDGSTRKVAKFKGENPAEMLKGEATDLIIIALALASIEGLNIRTALQGVVDKLTIRQTEFDAMEQKDES